MQQQDDYNVTHQELFDLFWQMYPRKVGKKLCQSIWNRKIKRNEVEQIYDGLNRWKESDQWQRDKGQFIPHPSTFLNQERWNDEVPATVELNLKSPETEEEVYIAMILLQFGIKTYCNSQKDLLNFYKTNMYSINNIKSCCPDILEAVQVISKMKKDYSSKGFSWNLASISRNFAYNYDIYQGEKYKRYR